MYIEEFPAGLIKCMLLVAYLTDRAFLWCLCVLADWILDEVWLTAPDISPDIDALHHVKNSNFYFHSPISDILLS